MMISFYKIRNSGHSQVEGRRSLINIRVGFTCFGLAWTPKVWKVKKNQYKWWLPHLSIGIFVPVGQCAQKRIFKLEINNKSIAYRTRGDATPDLSTYYDAGLEIR